MILLRHVLSIAILPFTVTVLIPWWIVRNNRAPLTVGTSPDAIALEAGGVAVLAVGLLLFVSSLRRFASDGLGTLAPWDPPRRLVVRGPYRFVRNPMISGVICILVAEAMLLRSRSLATWALTFLSINAIYIPLLEEPQLRMRFGDEYREYCRHVRRIVPHVRPWESRGHDAESAGR
jgi:protein-S-isoprenylcysteine O-methyltransferase Ste14